MEPIVIDYSKIKIMRDRTGKPYWFQVRWSGAVGVAAAFIQIVGAISQVQIKQPIFLKKIHLTGSYSDNTGVIKPGIMQAGLSVTGYAANRAPDALTLGGAGAIGIPNNIILYGQLNGTHSELEIGTPIEIPAASAANIQLGLAAQFGAASVATDIIDVICTLEFA